MGKKSFLFNIALVTLLVSNIYAGIVEKTQTTPMTGVFYGSVAVGDLDGDSDNDILLTGSDSSNTLISKIYLNDGNGSFSEDINNSLVAIWKGSVAIGDLDGDSDNDIIISGYDTNSTSISKIYLNNGSGSFSEDTSNSLAQVYFSSITIKDLDGDSDNDILLTGTFPNISKIYLNNGSGSFSEDTNNSLTGVKKGISQIADFDADNDMDILINGSTTSSGDISKIYLNNGNGNFSEDTNNTFYGSEQGSTAIGDLDGDSDLDIIIIGQNFTSYSNTAKIYLNDGNGSFSEDTINSLPNTINGFAMIADLDGDSDNDILITGDNGNTPISKIYLNDGNGSFSEDTTNSLTGVAYSTGVLADFNGDTLNDIFIVGQDSSNNIITPKIYIQEPNQAPVITEGERVWISLNEDSNTSFTLNATDSENDNLNWSIDTNATYGVASVSSTPSGTSQIITYTPEGNYSGGDKFVVKVADANGNDTIDVHIGVKPIQDKPIITSFAKTNDKQNYSEINSTDFIYEDSPYLYKLELADYDKEGLKVNPITLPSLNTIIFTDSNSSNTSNTNIATLTTNTTFNNPKYLTLYNNYLYISDQNNHLIKRINLTNDNNQSEIFAGNGNDGGSTCVGNVDKLQATLSAPAQLFFDNYGVLFVADATCNSIYRIDSNNSLSIVVTDTGDADGVLVDENGTIYYSDSTNDKIVKVENGNKTDLATALNGPDRMAFDNSGNILFSDIGTDTIKKINLSDNSVSVVIGDGTTGEAIDGTLATNGSINNPRGVWGADNGDIYFSDMGNNKIKRVDSSDGKIYTVVDLTNLSSSPYSFAFDTNRTMYIDGKSDDVIKKVNFYTVIMAMPTNDDVGVHTLELNISDGINSILKDINITVVNTNDTPTIDNNITYSTQVTGATTIDWKSLSNANDVDIGDVLTAVQKDAPSKGTISINENNVTYTPYANKSGSDEFNLTISDTNNSSVDVVVSITNIDTSNMSVALNYTNTLEESSSNDGSMSGSVVINLSGESFVDNVVSSNYVNASHLPSELDAKFERNSSTQITMTLNYNALEHLSSSYSDITITFSDNAFKNLNASEVSDSNKTISVTFYDGIISGLTPNVWQMVSVPTNIVVDTTTLSSQIVSGSSIWAFRNKAFVENPTDANAKEGLWVKPNSSTLKINGTVDSSYDYGFQYAQLNSWKCNLSANEWNFMGVEYAINWSNLTRDNITPDNGCVYTIIFNYDHNNDSWNSTDSISANSALWLNHICNSTPSCDNNNGR